MPRTTVDLVKKILRAGQNGSDYDDSTDLTPFIAGASNVVDRVVECAARKGQVLTGLQRAYKLGPENPSGSELELIERWYAAGLYCRSDKTYQQNSTGKASASFQIGTAEQGANEYIRQAVEMDPSNCLGNIIKNQKASLGWLGKPASAQIPINQRN